MKDIDKLDPAHIVGTCSQKHVQSVIEDLVEEVRRKHAEVERLKAAQPLTDGQIVGIAIGAGVDPDDEDDDGTTVFAIARAVEAACAKAWGVKLEGVRCNAGLGLVQKREQRWNSGAAVGRRLE